MAGHPRIKARIYWGATFIFFAAAMAMMIAYAPVDRQMGMVQKIFYVHLPVAFNTFGAALVVFIGSVGYLWHRRLKWDSLAAAAGRVTVLFSAVLLLTGMTWARSAWGAWWTWSPRLTFSLVLFLFYVVYLMIRPTFESRHRRAVVCALYGVLAFLDVPLVYLSVKLMPDIHPSSITLEPAMKHTLMVWFVPITMMMAGLCYETYRLGVRTQDYSRAADMEFSGEAMSPQLGRQS